MGYGFLLFILWIILKEHWRYFERGLEEKRDWFSQ